MFERRLKVFLGILLCFITVLLLRAVHLQLFTKSNWLREAEDFNKKPAYVETTRGRILDHNNLEIAVDEACMDACVDYRAISRDAKWINALAEARLKDRMGTQFTKATRKEKEELAADEAESINRDIDKMWDLLARESNQTREQIDEICHEIDLKVAMRTRWVQYKRYENAEKALEGSGPSPWYRRWLIEGGDGGPKVDDFEQESGEQVDVHPIIRNISQQVFMRLAKAAEHCPGLVLRPGTHRNYPYHKAGAHLIGSLGPVTKQDINADPNLGVDELRKYDFTDLIGRGGIEQLAEPTLRGTRGKVLRQIGKDKDDEMVTQPAAGGDVKITIDIEMQDEIQRMFAQMKVPSNKEDDTRTFDVAMHGAAVVIDIKTGAVRALASYPDFDVNELQEKYEELAGQIEDAPLMNRATQSQLEPGSTIKPVVGLGAITQGLLTPTSGIECTGYLVLNGHKYPNGRCWVASRYAKALGPAGVTHHPVPIPHKGSNGNPDGFLCFTEALERSCNVYFETCADKLGLEGLSSALEHMGLGHETGLGISEACGRLPRDLMSKGGAAYLPRSVVWFSGIGQAGVVATPIQMANVAATIARDGVWMRPRLIESDGVTLAPSPLRDGRVLPDSTDLGLNKEALKAAREGMLRVVNSKAGTGSAAQMPNLLVAGKTGTAQAAPPAPRPGLDASGKRIKVPLVPATADNATNTPWFRGWGPDGTQLNHAWFIGFAPANDPQVAVAVMVQYGGSGGGLAAKTATAVLDRCIEHGYVKVR